MTDILYHHYGGNDEAMYLSFAAAQELAKYIGVESEFGAFTIEGMAGTAMNRDTISRLFNNLLKDSEKYNNEKEMVFVHTSFLIGSFVEKVYYIQQPAQRETGQKRYDQGARRRHQGTAGNLPEPA